MIRTVIFLIISVVVFLLLLSNRDQMVRLQYPLAPPAQMIPLYLLLLGTFIAGFLLAVILIFPSWLKIKLDNRRSRKEIDGLEVEIGRLRTQAPPDRTGAQAAVNPESAEENL